MRKFILFLLSIILFGVTAAAQAAPTKAGRPGLDVTKTSAALSKEQRDKNIESFEMVWKTVLDTHYDPKFGGVDWQGVHKELRPKIEKAETMKDARNIMHDMLDRLGHSHVDIIPASYYDDNGGDSAKVNKLAVPGFDIRMVKGEAVVVRVTAGLPADKAGVRPGWLIHKIDDEEVAKTLESIRKDLKKHFVPIVQADRLRRRLSGEEGNKVTVTFKDGDGKEVTLPLKRAFPKGRRVEFGGLPAHYVQFEARKVDKNIAYLHFSSFSDPMRVMKAFGDTIKANETADGLIIDLRGNPGGLIDMARGMGGWFVDQPNQKLGTMKERHAATDLVLNPRDVTFKGSVAILVDEFSMSCSELLSGGLQDLKIARVFGRPTIGSALPSRLVRLPNGDRLQYVFADYVSAGGKRLEGNGVTPDEVVELDRQTLLTGSDPDMDAAVQWIRSQRGGDKK